jgi:hypothetical protein
MTSLGLSEIEELRNDLNCREGLLIDFDYADWLVELASTENKVEEELDTGSDTGSGGEEPDCDGDSEVISPLQSFGARTVCFFFQLHVSVRCSQVYRGLLLLLQLSCSSKVAPTVSPTI